MVCDPTFQRICQYISFLAVCTVYVLCVDLVFYYRCDLQTQHNCDAKRDYSYLRFLLRHAAFNSSHSYTALGDLNERNISE